MRRSSRWKSSPGMPSALTSCCSRGVRLRRSQTKLRSDLQLGEDFGFGRARQHLGQLARRIDRLLHQMRIGVERGGRHRGRQHHAVAIDDLGALGRQLADRRPPSPGAARRHRAAATDRPGAGDDAKGQREDEGAQRQAIARHLDRVARDVDADAMVADQRRQRRGADLLAAEQAADHCGASVAVVAFSRSPMLP